MILVTGATGNVGSELISHLAAAKQPVRALVRGDGPARVPADVEIGQGNLDEPHTLRGALKNVSRVFLLGGYRDMPGLMTELRNADVECVALLSSRSVINANESNAIVKMWMISEDAVQSSGIQWTILRPSGFMSNALRWLPQLKAGDTVRAPFADVRIAAIDPFDIAAVAAITLTTDGHATRAYELSGPEAILPEEQVRILAEVLRRSLRFQPQSDTDARADLARLFAPDFLDAMFRFYAEGEFDDSRVVTTVRDVTNRQPRNFKQWARAHASAFRYQVWASLAVRNTVTSDLISRTTVSAMRACPAHSILS